MTQKRITQETFDDVVRENIEEFEMEEAEAYADAVSQFQSQQVDLSNVDVKPRVAGEEPPLTKLIKAIDGAMDAEGNVADAEVLVSNIKAITVLFEEEESNRTQAGCNGGVEALFDCVNQKDAVIMPPALHALRVLCRNHVDNRDFVRAKGMICLAFAARLHADDPILLRSIFATVKVVCLKNEDNKVNFSKAGGNEIVFKAMEKHFEDKACTLETCGVIRSVTANDDPRNEFSQAFDCAKLFVEKGMLPELLKPMNLLLSSQQTEAESVFECAQEAKQVNGQNSEDQKGEDVSSAQVLGALCACCKSICQQKANIKAFCDLGGMKPIVNIITQYTSNANVCKHGIAVLRSISQDDDWKSKVADHQQLMLRCLQIHMKNALVCEQAVGVIANLCLKQTDNSTAIAAAGGIDLLLQVLQQHVNPPKTLCLRQTCLAIRNMVVRCPDLRKPFLDGEAEKLLREAHKYGSCNDEAYAALRDLQCEVASLNRRYTQKAAYEKASNFRDTFEESDNIQEQMQSESRAPFSTA
jgi:hypothetical protein